MAEQQAAANVAHTPAVTAIAVNTAAASENKIHDDAVARRFGFHGALVPGAEVYAYMAHLPVARWGRAWLEGGAAECRFLKPVYDGAVARVTASGEDGGLGLSVEVAAAIPQQAEEPSAIRRVQATPAPADHRPASTQRSSSSNTRARPSNSSFLRPATLMTAPSGQRLPFSTATPPSGMIGATVL